MKKFFLLSSVFISLLGASEKPPLLHVHGTGKVFIKTTLANARLGIEVEGKSSTDVQNNLSQQMNQLIEALKKANPLKLETSSFTVYPEYTDSMPRQIKSYRGVGEVMITIKSEESGQFIGLAMDSGATKVEGIELKATPEEIALANRNAIKEACRDAEISAKTALEALGLEWDEIVDVNLNPLEPSPRPFRGAISFAMEKSSQGPNLEGEQTVQADVALQIRFKN